MSHTGHLTADSVDQEEEIMDVGGELHEHEQWEPEKIHYEYYSGEPRDEDLYQKGRDDELRAMQDFGVFVEIPIREAVGGKHIRGFSIAQMKGHRVRWRFVATEVNTELREDNHQGTPPLMIVRATISRAGSCPTSAGVHMRMILSWDVRKAFFNADLNEVIYVHLGTNLCKAGHCWWHRKALYGTRMVLQMWGETVRALMDSGRWHCLQSVPNACYLPADGRHEDDSSSVCHGDDFLAEGSERTLSELDRLLSEHVEVTAENMIGPGRPGQT